MVLTPPPGWQSSQHPDRDPHQDHMPGTCESRGNLGTVSRRGKVCWTDRHANTPFHNHSHWMNDSTPQTDPAVEALSIFILCKEEAEGRAGGVWFESNSPDPKASIASLCQLSTDTSRHGWSEPCLPRLFLPLSEFFPGEGFPNGGRWCL